VRQLEVVAVSDDGTQVLLASAEDAARATHSVRIDTRLQAAVRGELDESERRESELSPKEIQARLRAGESEEQIAKLAKVPVSRVLRYAGPVISERDRIVEQAQGAVLQRARGPQASTPLGEMVDKRLGVTAGIRFDTVTWTARRRDDGAWIVALTYLARGGSRTASWLWQPAERELSSLNALATRLGAEEMPVARRKRAASKPAPTRTAAARTPAAKRTTVKRPTAKRAAAKRTTAKPAPPKLVVARTAARPPKPVVKPAPTPAAERAAKRALKRAANRRRPRPVAEPPVIEPAIKRANGRVAVPSWSDVLLGVQAPPAAARGRRRS
jgi:hypothetical protein